MYGDKNVNVDYLDKCLISELQKTVEDEPGMHCARKQGSAQRMTGHRSQLDLAPTGQIGKNFSIRIKNDGSGLYDPLNKIFHGSMTGDTLRSANFNQS